MAYFPIAYVLYGAGRWKSRKGYEKLEAMGVKVKRLL